MAAPEASSAQDLTGDYEDNSVTIAFALNFNAAKCACWWLLWLLAVLYAFRKRNVVSRAWFIYMMLLASCLFNAIQTSAYVGYADHVQKGHSGLVGYLVYLFFFNVARATFLAVLLVVASGYCITRSDLGPHKQHVVFVPVTVLVTGLITDYSFFALQSSPNADTYDLSTMSTLAASMWFVCSVLNLAALILAWLYIFEALGKETAALEEDYKARTGKLEEERRAEAAAEAAAVAAMAGHPGYAALAPPAGVAVGVPVVAPHTAAADVEVGGHDGETVADHIAYSAKRTLLSRFAAGVAAYLVADICVLLLPAFFNHVVQSTLQALLFLCYLVFTLVLLVLFRPQEASSYLMVGFSEEDAEEKGVNQLSTGIAMAELGGHGPDDSDEDEISRLNRPSSAATRPGGGLGAGRGGSSGALAGSSSGGGAATIVGARGAAKAEAKAAAKAAKAAKKAGKDDERYRQLPSLATTSADIQNFYAAGQGAGGAGTAAGNGASDGGASGLPVSTLAAGALPPPPSYGAAVALPPPPAPAGAQRGRQPRTYVPQPAAPSGPFTLGGEDEEDESAMATRPLTGGGKGQYQD